MNKLTLLTLGTLIATSAALAAPPQREAKILVEKPGLAIAMDDDGGRVEIYHRSHAAREIEFHDGAIVREPLVELLFVGSLWETPQMKTRAESLRRAIDHLSASDAFNATHDRGVKTTALPITTRFLEGGVKMNDLHLQVLIDKAMSKGSLPSRDENTIYVLFLAPDIESSLGDHHAGSDYASYHSHFHTQDVNVRYVVVPFDTDNKSMSDAAGVSLIRAILNPDGDGWY